MKKYYARGVILLFSFLFMVCPARAADVMYLFMHGDQDALILGRVKSVGAAECVIAVLDTVGEENPTGIEAVILDITAERMFYTFWVEDREIQAGDYLIASVNHEEGDRYRLAHGMYLIDSAKKSEAKLVLPDDADVWTRMDAAAMECFLQSDGEYREFYFNGASYEVGRYFDPENNRSAAQSVIIYKGTPDDASISPAPVAAPTPDPTPSPEPTYTPSPTLASTPTPQPVSGNAEAVWGMAAWIPAAIVVVVAAGLLLYWRAKRRGR